MLLTHAGHSKEKHLPCASKYLFYHFQVSSLFLVFNTSKQGRKRFCVITTEKTLENVSMLWIPAPVWGPVCFSPCRGISFPFAFESLNSGHFEKSNGWNEKLGQIARNLCVARIWARWKQCWDITEPGQLSTHTQKIKIK